MPTASISQEVATKAVVVPTVPHGRATIFEDVANGRNLSKRCTQEALLGHCSTVEHIEQLMVWLWQRGVEMRYIITPIKRVNFNLALSLARLRSATS